MPRCSLGLFVMGIVIGMALQASVSLYKQRPSSTPSVTIDVAQTSPEESTGRDRDNRLSLCMRDRECLSLAITIYYEARGEDIEGQIAVANVVLNRKELRGYPNTVYGVVSYKRRGVCHFSYRCERHWKNGIKDLSSLDLKSFKKSLDISSEALYIGIQDVTGKADHFLNKKKIESQGRTLPRWAKVYEHTVDIGNHSFYKRI